MKRMVALWLAIAWVGYALAPWYALDSGFWSFTWIAAYPDAEASPAVLQAHLFGRWWLAPIAVTLATPLAALTLDQGHSRFGPILIWSGALGLVWTLFQGFAIGPDGAQWRWLAAAAGP